MRFQRHTSGFRFSMYALMSCVLSVMMCLDMSFEYMGALFSLTWLHCVCVYRGGEGIVSPLFLLVICACGYVYDVHTSPRVGCTSLWGMSMMVVMERFMEFVQKRPHFIWIWGSYALMLIGYVICFYGIAHGFSHLNTLFSFSNAHAFAWLILFICAYPMIMQSVHICLGAALYARS